MIIFSRASAKVFILAFFFAREREIIFWVFFFVFWGVFFGCFLVFFGFFFVCFSRVSAKIFGFVFRDEPSKAGDLFPAKLTSPGRERTSRSVFVWLGRLIPPGTLNEPLNLRFGHPRS